MTGKHVYHTDGTESFFIDGRKVTEAEWNAAFPSRLNDGPVGEFDGAWKRPLLSDALSVHPRQAKAAEAHARKKGVNVQFKADGSPIFTSRKQRADYCKVMGYFDKSAGYADAADGSFRGDRPDRPKEEYGL